MKKVLAAIALTAAGCALTSGQAAVVSFTYGIPILETRTEINRAGTLGLFDSSLGTLTGATFDLLGSATFVYTGTNTAVQPTTARLTSTTDLFFTSSLSALSPFLTSLSLSSTSGFQSYAVGQTRSFGPDARSAGSSNDLSSILGSLSANGGGTFNVGCESFSGFVVTGGGGNISSTQQTDAGCGARITYAFDPSVQPPTGTVPEPGSVALIGLAFVAMGVVRRKSKNNKA